MQKFICNNDLPCGCTKVTLRPNVFMQNLSNYYGQAIRDTGIFYLAQGDGKVSFIDVRDVAAAAVETLTSGGHEGKSYSLTGSESLSYYQVAEILSRAAGKKIEYVALSEEQALQQSRARDLPEFLIEVGKSMDAFGRGGGFAPVNSVYQQITNRQPVRFEQFAMDYAEAFK